MSSTEFNEHEELGKWQKIIDELQAAADAKKQNEIDAIFKDIIEKLNNNELNPNVWFDNMLLVVPKGEDEVDKKEFTYVHPFRKLSEFKFDLDLLKKLVEKGMLLRRPGQLREHLPMSRNDESDILKYISIVRWNVQLTPQDEQTIVEMDKFIKETIKAQELAEREKAERERKLGKLTVDTQSHKIARPEFGTDYGDSRKAQKLLNQSELDAFEMKQKQEEEIDLKKDNETSKDKPTRLEELLEKYTTQTKQSRYTFHQTDIYYKLVNEFFKPNFDPNAILKKFNKTPLELLEASQEHFKDNPKKLREISSLIRTLESKITAQKSIEPKVTPEDNSTSDSNKSIKP